MNELGNTPADKNYKPSGTTKAQEAALKAFPGQPFIHDRCVFRMGYEEAEKDAALVPKDIEEIIHIYHIVKMTINEDDDEFYQDILDEYYRRKALEEQE